MSSGKGLKKTKKRNLRRRINKKEEEEWETCSCKNCTGECTESSESDEDIDMDVFHKVMLSMLKMKSNNTQYVQIALGDDLRTLPKVFLGHPDKHEPYKEPGCDRCYEWGLYVDDVDFLQVMNRKMHTQYLYSKLGDSDISDPPEIQYVKRLICNKEKALAKRPKDLCDRDFILKIEMDGIKPEIWRRFKVSGAVYLNVLQDKIISPIMGWTRNYHAYYFTDFTDGALYGPVESKAIDIMWKGMGHGGYEHIDDRNYQLGVVVQNVGDELGYLYDLGDQWAHILTVEKILSKEESDGKCVVLEGEMACPPEDSNGCDGKGNQSYMEFLEKLPPKEKWQGPDFISYRLKRAFDEANTSMNVKPKKFDPYRFKLEQKRRDLADALKSRTSTHTGPKMFVHEFNPGLGAGGKSLREPNDQSHAGERYVKTPQHDWSSSSYMTETLKTQRDSKEESLCASCGSPKDLHLCAACRMVRYCSRSCQKSHWKAGHKKECKELAKLHKDVKKEIKAERAQQDDPDTVD